MLHGLPSWVRFSAYVLGFPFVENVKDNVWNKRTAVKTKLKLSFCVPADADKIVSRSKDFSIILMRWIQRSLIDSCSTYWQGEQIFTSHQPGLGASYISMRDLEEMYWLDDSIPCPCQWTQSESGSMTAGRDHTSFTLRDFWPRPSLIKKFCHNLDSSKHVIFSAARKTVPWVTYCLRMECCKISSWTVYAEKCLKLLQNSN